MINQKENNTTSIWKKGIDYSYSHSSFDTFRQNQYAKKKVKRIIKKTLASGSLASLTFLMITGYFFMVAFYTEHLPNSKLYMSSQASALIWIYPVQGFLSGFGQGFGVCISRCIGIKDWRGVRYFLRMHLVILSIWSVSFFFIYIILVFIGQKFLYLEKEFYYNIQKVIIAFFFTTIQYGYTITFRNAFISFGHIYTSMCIEFVGLAVMQVAGKIYPSLFKMDFTGILLAILTTLMVCLIEYSLCWRYGSLFKKYRSYLKTLDQRELQNNNGGSMSKNAELEEDRFVSSSNSDIEPAIINTRKKSEAIPKKSVVSTITIRGKNHSQKSYKNYIEFTAIWSFIGFFGVSWLQINNFIITKNFPKEVIAAQGMVSQFDVQIECVSIGFSFYIIPELSKLLIRKDIKSAKQLCQIFLMITLTITSMIALICYSFSDLFSTILTNDKTSQYYLSRDLKTWAFFGVSSSIRQSQSSIVRSIGKQKEFLAVQLICNYGIQFLVQWALLKFYGDSVSVWISSCVSSVFINIMSGVILCRTDWKYEAKKMRESMK